MDKSQEIQNALKRFNARTDVIAPAVVTAVNEGDATCDVINLEGLELYDLRLRAAVDGESAGVIPIPEVGSQVMIADVSNSQREFAVLLTTSLQKLLMYAPVVELGDVDGEKAVKGETLNDALTTLNGNLAQLISDLTTFCTTQAAACVGPLAPLAAGFTTLGASLAVLSPDVTAWDSTLNDHLSTIVKIA